MEDRNKDIQTNIWRGQALNMAWQEAIAHGKVTDVKAVFDRAKEIFQIGYQVKFFEWASEEKVDKPETVDKPEIEAEIVAPVKTIPVYGVFANGSSTEILKDKDIQLIHLGNMEGDYRDWKGPWKKCPQCKKKIPAPVPVHDECGYLFNPYWHPLPNPGESFKVCRRCGESVPKSWKKHSYKKNKQPCGYVFTQEDMPPEQKSTTVEKIRLL